MSDDNIPLCNGCKYIDTALFSMEEGCYPQCWHPMFEGRDIIKTNNPIGKDEKFPRPNWCPLRNR